MGDYLGYSSLLGIGLIIACIALAWWALQAFRFDLFTHNPNSPQARGLQVILSLVLGYLLALFFLDFLSWSLNIVNFF